jgi:hypothetical protein
MGNRADAVNLCINYERLFNYNRLAFCCEAVLLGLTSGRTFNTIPSLQSTTETSCEKLPPFLVRRCIYSLGNPSLWPSKPVQTFST